MLANTAREILSNLASGESFLILTHKNPDGDALGSALALMRSLRLRGKVADVGAVGVVADSLRFLPGVEALQDDFSLSTYDCVVLLDCATFSRVGLPNAAALGVDFKKLLVIDHHPRMETENSVEAVQVNWIDERKSSACFMIYELLSEGDAVIDREIATCLLTGIFTDTGGFQHSNTDAETLLAAGALMKCGARVDKIARELFNGKNLSATKLWGHALSHIETDPTTGMVIAFVSQKDLAESGAKKEDLEGLVSLINTVSDADFSLLLTETEDNKLKGSLRSESYKAVDVSQIARELGGGGHKLASGFEIGGKVEESLARIKELVLLLKKEKS